MQLAELPFRKFTPGRTADLGGRLGADLQTCFLTGGRAIALGEFRFRWRSPRPAPARLAPRAYRVRDGLPTIEQTGVQAGVLVDGDRAGLI